MATGMPELGSKISLISKADIRYEGRLFTVDPQECTIALANVRSFGTEDRDTQFPVAPQNQVYEYILFRGSDIKDIRVITNVNNLPNDPAIVQMTVPTSLGGQSLQQPSAGGYGPSIMSQLNNFNSHYGPAQMGISVATVSPVMASLTGNQQQQQRQQQPNKDAQSILTGFNEVISKPSRSNTPGSNRRTSPPIGEKPPPKERPKNQADKKPIGDRQRSDDPQQSRVNNFSNNRNAANYPIQHQQHQQPQQRGGGRGGWANNNQGMRGGQMRMGRGRGGGQAQGNNRNQNQGARGKTLKFDNDYDFEQANTEFEELRLQLSKVRLEGVAGAAAVEIEKKDDEVREECEVPTSTGGDSEDADVIHYDKSKSFFDNISCEAVERSKGRSQRTDWRTERKLNSETFGVTSLRRGGYRGRGFYMRNMHNKPNFGRPPMNDNYMGDDGMQQQHHRMPSRGNYRNYHRGGMRNKPNNQGHNSAEDNELQGNSKAQQRNSRVLMT